MRVLLSIRVSGKDTIESLGVVRTNNCSYVSSFVGVRYARVLQCMRSLVIVQVRYVLEFLEVYNPIQYGPFLKHYGMGGHYAPPCNFSVS